MGNQLRILSVLPQKAPVEKIIEGDLDSLQHEVHGYIEPVYPFQDNVCLLCNDEGLNLNLPLNRAVRREDGSVYNVISGPFIIVGIKGEVFTSLSDEQVIKYKEYYKHPEYFAIINGELVIYRGNI